MPAKAPSPRNVLLAVYGDSESLYRVAFADHAHATENAQRLAALTLMLGSSHPVTVVALAAALRDQTPERLLQIAQQAAPAAARMLIAACQARDDAACMLMLHLARAGWIDLRPIMDDADERVAFLNAASKNGALAAAIALVNPDLTDQERALIMPACKQAAKTIQPMARLISILAPNLWMALDADDRIRVIRSIDNAGSASVFIENVGSALSDSEAWVLAQFAPWTAASLYAMKMHRQPASLSEATRMMMIAKIATEPYQAADVLQAIFDNLFHAASVHERAFLLASIVSHPEAASRVAQSLSRERWNDMTAIEQRIMIAAGEQDATIAQIALQRVGADLAREDVRRLVQAALRSGRLGAERIADIADACEETLIDAIDADLRCRIIRSLERSPQHAARVVNRWWNGMTDEERLTLVRAAACAQRPEAAQSVAHLICARRDAILALPPSLRASLLHAVAGFAASAATVILAMHEDLDDDARSLLAESLRANQDADAANVIAALIEAHVCHARSTPPDVRARVVRAALVHPPAAARVAHAWWETLTETERDALVRRIAAHSGAALSFVLARHHDLRGSPHRQLLWRTIEASHDNARRVAQQCWSALDDEAKDVCVRAFLTISETDCASAEFAAAVWERLTDEQRQRVLNWKIETALAAIAHMPESQRSQWTGDHVSAIAERALQNADAAVQALNLLQDMMTDDEIAALTQVIVSGRSWKSIRLNAERLRRMNAPKRHVVWSCLPLLEARDVLDLAIQTCDWMDDEDRAAALRSMGVTSQDVALLLGGETPWQAWMKAFLPDEESLSDDERSSLLRAWSRVSERVPYPYVLRLPLQASSGERAAGVRSGATRRR